MKAVQIKEQGQIHIIERDKPTVQNKNDICIKIKAVGICGSDMHIYHGTNPMAIYPRIIGHEVAGEVESVGQGVTDLQPGDKVVLEPIRFCGKCYACRTGRPNVCMELEVYGVHCDGGLQEFIVVPKENVHKVNQEVPWEEAALVEPFTIGAQATRRGDVQQGDTVFIMGAGPIGLTCLKMALSKGATCIISDLSEDRLTFAKQWGAQYTIDASKVDVTEEIIRLTDQMGANVVIDAVGTKKTVEQAVQCASHAGRIVTLGFNEQSSQIAQLHITKKELTVAGSRLQTNQFPTVIELFNNRNIQPGEIVSHQFDMEQIEQAIGLIEQEPDQVRKVVLRVNRGDN